MTECGTNQPIEKVPAAEDAVSSHVSFFDMHITLTLTLAMYEMLL
jgi:hypothetical protein